MAVLASRPCRACGVFRAQAHWDVQLIWPPHGRRIWLPASPAGEFRLPAPPAGIAQPQESVMIIASGSANSFPLTIYCEMPVRRSRGVAEDGFRGALRGKSGSASGAKALSGAGGLRRELGTRDRSRGARGGSIAPPGLYSFLCISFPAFRFAPCRAKYGRASGALRGRSGSAAGAKALSGARGLRRGSKPGTPGRSRRQKTRPQRLKPHSLAPLTARLRPCPDEKSTREFSIERRARRALHVRTRLPLPFFVSEKREVTHEIV